MNEHGLTNKVPAKRKGDLVAISSLFRRENIPRLINCQYGRAFQSQKVSGYSYM